MRSARRVLSAPRRLLSSSSKTGNELLRPYAGVVPATYGASVSAPLLIEGGTLIDGTGAEPVPNEAIFIVGDEIRSVGAAAKQEAAAFTDAARGPVRRIDANGQWVLPGLIDAHCHVSFLEPSSNDELFFHRQSEGLTAILAAQSVKKLLLSGCTGFLDADVMYNIGECARALPSGWGGRARTSRRKQPAAYPRCSQVQTSATRSISGRSRGRACRLAATRC